jgi:hypothetical protein
MFCDRVLDLFGDSPAAAMRMYSKKAFDKFCEDYKEEYIMDDIRPEEFEAQELPL